MRVAATIILLFVFSFICLADTIHVPGDQPTIQAGIDASKDGDTVLVAPGTYVENIDFKGKAITVKSGQGSNLTVIDGNRTGPVVTFQSEVNSDSMLEGFTLTNGYTTHGGGIYCYKSSPIITNNIITDNEAEKDGGGILCHLNSSPIIIKNIITGNKAAYGGGIQCSISSPTITDNLIMGNTANASSSSLGGGIRCYDSSPTIANNTIMGNVTLGDGGGIYCRSSSPDIESNIIIGNEAVHDGGGVCCFHYSTPNIISNNITNNTAGTCGGIYCLKHSPATISNNFIVENNGNYGGGGIYCELDSSSNIMNNVVMKNSGDYGGGIFCHDCSPIIKRNFISENTAQNGGGIISRFESSPIIMGNIITKNDAQDGGGIYCHKDSNPVITTNNITGNKAKYGGGISCHYNCSPCITNNTISRNEADSGGGTFFYYSFPTITNTILWNNSATVGPEMWIGDSNSPSITTISFSDVKGGLSSVFIDIGSALNWGSGMIDADPLFVDAANGDFHLTFISPCKDIGDNSAVTEYEDFEGDPRIANGIVDMGADEFYTHLYYTGEATPGGHIEVNIIGIPGQKHITLFAGTDVLDPFWPTQYGDWYLQLPIVTLRVFNDVPYDGVIVLPSDIPPTYPPWDIPLQTIVGDQLTNLCVMKVE